MSTYPRMVLIYEGICDWVEDGTKCGETVRVPFEPDPNRHLFCPKHWPLEKKRRAAVVSRHRRAKRQSIPAKPCVVVNLITGDIMGYDKQERVLLNEPGLCREFPSVQKARAALWRTLNAERDAGFFWLPRGRYQIQMKASLK